jgi:hypothetical protein
VTNQLAHANPRCPVPYFGPDGFYSIPGIIPFMYNHTLGKGEPKGNNHPPFCIKVPCGRWAHCPLFHRYPEVSEGTEPVTSEGAEPVTSQIEGGRLEPLPQHLPPYSYY